ncbi:probable tyrosyl-DNA phosphodiesterase [Anabrus simplex]|uniref:probable tyrosyl-DNA phosphodiesterase n=1 Tax=Anabrus simplex TaxID=316456 RepID=UPI0035A3B6AB
MESQTRGKRVHESGSGKDVGEPVSKKSTVCMFGEKCYRKNMIHLTEYSHPHLDKLLRSLEDVNDPKLPDDFKPQIDYSIILDQLCILRKIYDKKDKEEKSSTTSDKSTSSPSQSNSSKNQNSTRDSPSKGFGRPSRLSSKVDKNAGKENGRYVDEPTNCDVAARLEAAAPYYFFLTKVRSVAATHVEPLSITFRELLDPSLGKLEASCQINYMVEMPWLMHHYFYHKLGEKPLLIIYGDDNDDLRSSALPKNITAVRIKTPHPFGHHHTKMSLFYYADGSLRVVVSTANLVASDWHNRTQGVWVSPLCPPLPAGADTSSGESPTEFKADLLRYLCFYKLPQLQDWVGRIRRADFSHIRVFFIASVPGSHQGPDIDRWGHRRLGSILKKYCNSDADSSWPILAQCSSIGSLGQDPEAWMIGELRASMAQSKGAPAPRSPPPFRVIYPSKQNVMDSLDGLMGGDCLPYSIRTHQKQMWFTAFLYQWKSSKRLRTGAVPHIKTYGRISPDGKQLAWFHLSSANLSKAAWGINRKTKASGAGLFMMSYEAGVLFLPQMLIDSPAFNLDQKGEDGSPPFPLPYDYPLVRYEAGDKPFVMEYLEALLRKK